MAILCVLRRYDADCKDMQKLTRTEMTIRVINSMRLGMRNPFRLEELKLFERCLRNFLMKGKHPPFCSRLQCHVLFRKKPYWNYVNLFAAIRHQAARISFIVHTCSKYNLEHKQMSGESQTFTPKKVSIYLQVNQHSHGKSHAFLENTVFQGWLVDPVVQFT